ncbi:DUF2285 domain-containing protein [Bradyrhizobium sp. C9]|uniref:DUF2285 domain-containing protein n=1 Tax=Bradyrhizobium sp. C9 TaxID=142585 RepID=UPI000BE90F7B|nr:DUF2285 domain-containing protein [Bradyrhizobium sp. C9]PDT74320.1 hypothetical protein CO675_26480 [Bradyrhizobium sp. C9]
MVPNQGLLQRCAGDGWHAVLRIGVVDHCVWSKGPPAAGARYTAKRPFDADFKQRAFAARRMWQAAGPAFRDLSKQRRERLSEAMRALDAKTTGSTYHAIAETLFGKKRIPERAWKTLDLRNRTVRLVQTCVPLVCAGYRRICAWTQTRLAPST